MKNRNNSAGFALVGGLIVALIVVVIAIAGWFVYNQVRDKDTTMTDSSSNSERSKSTQQESDVTSVSSVEITELGLKINDPDNRQMTIEEVVIQSPFDEGTATVQAIIPVDYPEEFKGICAHPAHIYETTADDISNNVKKIGDKYFVIGRTIMGCGGSAEMSVYVKDLNTYIVNNITTM